MDNNGQETELGPIMLGPDENGHVEGGRGGVAMQSVHSNPIPIDVNEDGRETELGPTGLGPDENGCIEGEEADEEVEVEMMLRDGTSSSL